MGSAVVFHLWGKVAPLLLIRTNAWWRMGNWRSEARIITLATRLRWVANCTPLSHYMYYVSLRDGLCWLEHFVIFVTSSRQMTELFLIRVLEDYHILGCTLKCEQSQEPCTWWQRRLLVHQQGSYLYLGCPSRLPLCVPGFAIFPQFHQTNYENVP